MNTFNHTRKLFANGEITLTNLKVMLTNGYTFAPAETTMTNATAAEVSGNGWVAGGPTIASAAITIANTDGAKLDGNDISVTASGGPIGPADGLVVYDATGSWPLFHDSFASQEAGDGTAFKVTWDAAGIHVWQDVV